MSCQEKHLDLSFPVCSLQEKKDPDSNLVEKSRKSDATKLKRTLDQLRFDLQKLLWPSALFCHFRLFPLDIFIQIKNGCLDRAKRFSNLGLGGRATRHLY